METSLKLLELACFFDLNKVYLPTIPAFRRSGIPAFRVLGQASWLYFKHIYFIRYCSFVTF